MRNEVIELRSEDLYVSPDLVRVTYHFRNISDAPATFLVAFPLPVIDATVPEALNVILPDGGVGNFVDFTVTVDGIAITPEVDQRATAQGVQRTAELRERGLPLNPVEEGLFQRLEALPAAEVADLNRLGLVIVDPYSIQAAWKLETTFYWEQGFPPGRDVVVEHSYRPVIGHGYFGDFALDDADYRAAYCLDDAFATAARRRLAAIANTPEPYFQERRLAYILTTANTWSGPIGSFRLVVDKGSPEALVSFCGEGVRKISETQFELTRTDFSPERELEVLFVLPRAGQ